MVFRRRPPFRKFKKFRRFRRKINPGILALKKIKKMIQIKYNDESLSTNIASDAPVITHVSAIGAGTDESDRVGDQLLAQSIHLRVQYTQAVDTTAIVRTIIVIDRQQVGDTAPTFAQLLTSASVEQNLNLSTAGRFQVLWDHTKVLMPLSADANIKYYINKYIKLRKPVSIRYNGTASTDIQKNGIYLMQISDRAAASSPVGQTGTIRLGYTDG